MTLLALDTEAKPSLQYKIDSYVRWGKEKEPIYFDGIRKFLRTNYLYHFLESRIKSFGTFATSTL